MLEPINKENFNSMLAQFSTGELEGMVEKFPYFQHAHLLLAKKYQQENSPKFDQQLQLAALYVQDRELLYNLFNERATVSEQIPQTVIAEPKAEVKAAIVEVETPQVTIPEIITTAPIETIVIKETARALPPVTEQVTQQEPKDEISLKSHLELIEQSAKELSQFTEASVEEKPEAVEAKVETAIELPVAFEDEKIKERFVEPPEAETEEPELDEPGLMVEAPPVEVFSRIQPHTFDEWLKAFNNKQTAEIKEKPLVTQDEKPEDEEEDEISQLLAENVSVDYLHELVKEETNYSKGLERFIEEQIQKHKQPEQKKAAPKTTLNTGLATETMAKVYEMQKKYSKAIETYEALTLKFPEKSSLFAARITYLKNIT